MELQEIISTLSQTESHDGDASRPVATMLAIYQLKYWLACLIPVGSADDRKRTSDATFQDAKISFWLIYTESNMQRKLNRSTNKPLSRLFLQQLRRPDDKILFDSAFRNIGDICRLREVIPLAELQQRAGGKPAQSVRAYMRALLDSWLLNPGKHFHKQANSKYLLVAERMRLRTDVEELKASYCEKMPFLCAAEEHTELALDKFATEPQAELRSLKRLTSSREAWRQYFLDVAAVQKVFGRTGRLSAPEIAHAAGSDEEDLIDRLKAFSRFRELGKNI